MSKHYSHESLVEIAGGDDYFMKVVAQTFLEEIPSDLKALEEAVELNNKELAYQFAHKMKPNLEMFGVELVDDIKSIESWTKTSTTPEKVKETVNKVSVILNVVFKELKEDFNL